MPNNRTEVMVSRSKHEKQSTTSSSEDRNSSQMGEASESESLLLAKNERFNYAGDKLQDQTKQTDDNTRCYGSVPEIESPHSSGIDDEEATWIDPPLVRARQQQQRLSITGDSNLLKDEMKSMIELFLPVCATYVLEMLPGITTIILVGRMSESNKVHLDGAALAVMFLNITAMSTGLGLLTAMDTLCSHAHGANQPSKMGQYLLTGMFVMLITCVVVGLIIWNTTPILLACGQQSTVAMEAGYFAKYMLPSIPFMYAYEMLRKISQARNEATPMIISAVVSNIVNVGLGYYLVNCTPWGWLGAAVARSVGAILMLPALILSMMYCEQHNNTKKAGMEGQIFHHLWEGFQPSQALTPKAVVQFLDLGIPGMFQLMFAWIAFEIIALLCGLIPDPEEALIAIGSNAIVLNVVQFVYMLYMGTSVAGSVRIGNALGAGDAHRAKVATYLAVTIGTLLSFVNMAFLVTFRDNLASIFTKDEDLLNKCQSLFIVVAMLQLPDALNSVEQGVFRASGRQSLSAKLTFVAYYIIGVPLGYYLALPLGVGVEGLWIGIFAGLLVISTANAIVIWMSDWDALATAARDRL